MFGKSSIVDHFPSVVMLAVAEGYDTFNIVFIAIGDGQASECSLVSSTQ